MSLKLHILPTLKLIFVQAVLNTVVYQLLIVYTNVLVSSAVLRVYITRYKHDRGWGEFETVMQTRDKVEGLHNGQEFSQPHERLYQDMQTKEKKFSIAFMK